MKTTRVSMIAALSIVLVPGFLVAQSAPRIEISGRAGMLIPLNDLGPAAPAGTAWHLQLERADATPAFEIMARAAWPGSMFGSRLVATWAVPTNASGFFNCNPGLACPAVLLPSDAEIGMMAVVGDLVLSPRAGRALRPWVALGAGMRRYSYSWSDAAVLVNSGTHAETALALHAGVGFDFDSPVGSLQLEVADYWSPEGDVIARAAGSIASANARRNAQNDILATIGWRLLRF